MNTRHPQNRNLTLHTQHSYRGLPVQIGHGPLILNDLKVIHGVVHQALIDHPRTCAIRVDIRMRPEDELKGSAVMSKFIASLKSQIEEDLKGKRVTNKRTHDTELGYVWVKEKNHSLSWHYHLVILVNRDTYHCLGDYSATSGNMAARLKRAWASALGADIHDVGRLVFFPDNAVYIVDANALTFNEAFRDLFYRVSYFAKVATKHFNGNGNHIGYSRIRRSAM